MDATLAERIELIQTDRAHGGSWLARQAVEAIVEAAQMGESPLEIGRAAAAARPAMGAIPGAVGRVLAAARTPEQVIEEGRALIAQRDRAAKAIAVLVHPDVTGTVMTHSASATVREALLHAQPERVVCTASEPIGEGRAFAEELRAAGLVTELVADGDAPHAVETVDLLLVGADTVFRDGSLINKVGTADLAEAAKKAGVPVVVACEVIKLAPVEVPDPPLTNDEGLFELTPPELIDRFVTEEGVFTPAEIPSLVDRTPFLRDGYALLAGS